MCVAVFTWILQPLRHMHGVSKEAYARDKLCLHGNPEVWEEGTGEKRPRLVRAHVVPTGLGLPESTCAVRCVSMPSCCCLALARSPRLDIDVGRQWRCSTPFFTQRWASTCCFPSWFQNPRGQGLRASSGVVVTLGGNAGDHTGLALPRRKTRTNSRHAPRSPLCRA